MSAGTHGAGCGLVLGIVLALLLQQFGYVSLSALVPALETLVLGALLGLILGGLIGWRLGRRWLRGHPAAAPPVH
ncbi:MAG: hypothetical protein L3J91_00585 [Thermoplasmata archaeon]|nr:hypothetical protein [Thermoplasmata archaeon]